jgi:hypothetical protein
MQNFQVLHVGAAIDFTGEISCRSRLRKRSRWANILSASERQPSSEESGYRRQQQANKQADGEGGNGVERRHHGDACEAKTRSRPNTDSQTDELLRGLRRPTGQRKAKGSQR